MLFRSTPIEARRRASPCRCTRHTTLFLPSRVESRPHRPQAHVNRQAHHPHHCHQRLVSPPRFYQQGAAIETRTLTLSQPQLRRSERILRLQLVFRRAPRTGSGVTPSRDAPLLALLPPSCARTHLQIPPQPQGPRTTYRQCQSYPTTRPQSSPRPRRPYTSTGSSRRTRRS